MNITQNVMSRTRITHDKFRSYKIQNGLITMATNQEKLVARFRKKFPSNPFLIWQICLAMSANDLINFLEQNILKWPFSGHFEF